MADVARRAMKSLMIAAFAFTLLTTSALGHVGKSAAAEGAPAIQLSGAVKAPAEIWIANLKSLPINIVAVTQQTDHGPVSESFKGALLWTVIDNAGWANGPEKNAQIRRVVLVSGKDGYTAAIGEGEIDPKLEGKQVILAYEQDGKPLDAPRLVVPGDMHAARSVHDVAAITVQ
jgi:DMSO/TMAO reductase YedYZ molybdopterin-dependent catalytic subunit